MTPNATVMTIAQYFFVLLCFVPVIWGVAEGLSKLRSSPQKPKVSEARTAIVLGPLFAFFSWGFGWLPMLPLALASTLEPLLTKDAVTIVVLLFNFLWALFSGVLATFGAKVFNDSIMKPLGWKLRK